MSVGKPRSSSSIFGTAASAVANTRGKLPGRKSKEHLSAQRINHVMGVLRPLLEDGADRFQFTSPYQRIKPLKLAKSDVQPFTLNEVQLILQTVRKDFANYLKVRFFTGMRTGEVDGLKRRYVDFERRLILIRETVVNGQEDTTKTYESARDIQMFQVVCDALKAQYRATGDASPYVFWTGQDDSRRPDPHSTSE